MHFLKDCHLFYRQLAKLNPGYKGKSNYLYQRELNFKRTGSDINVEMQ